jgi:hypothetical protein
MSILIIHLLEVHFHDHTPPDPGIDFVYTNTDGVDQTAALRICCLASAASVA